MVGHSFGADTALFGASATPFGSDTNPIRAVTFSFRADTASFRALAPLFSSDTNPIRAVASLIVHILIHFVRLLLLYFTYSPVSYSIHPSPTFPYKKSKGPLIVPFANSYQCFPAMPGCVIS